MRVRRGRLSRLLLVCPLLTSVGCLVSFEGYELTDSDAAAGGDSGSAGFSGVGGQAGSSGQGTGGAAGGAGTAGSSAGGTAGSAGFDGGAGVSGSSGSGGSAGIAGSAGKAGSSGSGGSAGKGGSAGASGSAGKGGSAGAAGTGGSAGKGGSSGGSGTGGTGGTTTCPTNLPGPPLLEIPKPGGGSYCIDRSEVTNSQYKTFLDASKTGIFVPVECSSNESYAPATSGTTCTNTHFEPALEPTHPVTCVDWCDAVAYCAWAGKRLCGDIGDGPVSVTDFANPSRSQWHNACSMGGQRKFPYGNTYAGVYCNGLDYNSTRAIAVVTAANCQGGYAGLYDMSGNVREWEDGCDGSGNCLQRGGSYLDWDSSSTSLRCHSGSDTTTSPTPPTAPRFERSAQRGFRCCLTLL